MKRIIILFCLLFLVVGCSDKKEEVVIKKVGCDEAMVLVKDGAVFIDVRSEIEYKTNHLDNAINISYDVIKDNIESVASDKDTKIVLYCRSGSRSATAANTLLEMGYTHIYDLGSIDQCSK